jgi:TonB family protein
VDHVYRITAMLSNEWKLPFNIAIGIHVLVLLGALYLPGIFKAKPKFADIYTVSIINVAEPSASSPAPAKIQKAIPPPPVKTQRQSPPPVIVPPKKIQKAVPIAEAEEKVAPAPAPEPVAQKAVSLKPLKKKKIETVKPPEDQVRKQEIERDKQRKQKIERSKRQKLAEAIREEELLAEKARLAQEALEAERQLLRAQPLAESSPVRPLAGTGNQTSSTAASVSGSTSLLESQYLASVFNRLHQFWAPPEYLQQDPNLTAVVVITINQDGTIANMLVESGSGNRVFDQFVNKTIEAAAPMPPIPPALKKQRFEIGLRFRPGSIQ